MKSQKYISSFIEFDIDNFFHELEVDDNKCPTSTITDTTNLMTYYDYSYFKAEYEQPHIKIIPLDAEKEGISFITPEHLIIDK
jgi:hypothetical protein